MGLSSHKAPGCHCVQSVFLCNSDKDICRNLAALAAEIGMPISKAGCRKYIIPSLRGSAALLQIASAVVHRSLGYTFHYLQVITQAVSFWVLDRNL